MAASSCKRTRRAYAATGVESNSWPSVSAGSQTCLFPECLRPLLNSESEREFCGDMHRNLCMSNRAMIGSCVAASSPSLRGLEELKASSVCMLPRCGKKAFRDQSTGQHFDFCGKKHMLKMVEEMTQVWSQEGRLCKFGECYHHVYVEEDGRLFDYCGMIHATLAAAKKGETMMPEASAIVKRRSTDCREMICTTSGQAQHNGKEGEIESLVDSEVGYHEKISDSELLRLLKGGANEERCTRVFHGINIYDFHPWELVYKFGGYRPRYFSFSVTQQQQTGNPQQRRKTKDGFSWKQSGPLHSSESKEMETRYFKYMLDDKPEKYGHLPHVKEYIKFKSSASNPQNSGEKKGMKESGKSGKRKCRWKMHQINLCEKNPHKVVWMIFQEAAGEPVWPPCRQPHSLGGVPVEICDPDVILNPSQLQDFQAHEENDVGTNEAPLDTVRSMSDICDTDFFSGLADCRSGNSIEYFDLYETDVDPESSAIAEESHNLMDTDCLWSYSLQESNHDYTSVG